MGFFGIDWLAAILTIWAIYLLGNKQRSGFLIMIAGNVAWIFLGVMVESVAMVLSNAIFMIMNLRGYWHWSHINNG